MSTTSTPISDIAKAAEKTAESMKLVSRILSDFQPLHQPTNSPIPNLMDWVKRQPVEFQAQISTMPQEVFLKEFKQYCPNCLLDHRTMTPGFKLVGICIQCQYYLNTGLRGAAQKK